MDSLIQQVFEEQKTQQPEATQTSVQEVKTEPSKAFAQEELKTAEPTTSNEPAQPIQEEVKTAEPSATLSELPTKPTHEEAKVAESPTILNEPTPPKEEAKVAEPSANLNELPVQPAAQEAQPKEAQASLNEPAQPVHEEAKVAEPPVVVQETHRAAAFTSPEAKPAFSAPKEIKKEKTMEQEILEKFGVELRGARIVVVGCGGAGNNTVNRLSGMGIKGAKTVALNTDARHLSRVKADERILIGKDLTRGLGAGGHPEVGKKAAEETGTDIKRVLKDADMVYILAGLGGGTGTGSAPVVAKYAKEAGAIVIGAVTMPFKIEGTRQVKAEDGLTTLRQVCDTTIVVENDKLLKVAGDLPLDQAFGVADNLFATMIKGITETISEPSLVNLDYADVKTIMHSGGVATVGFGECDTTNRAEEAIAKALSNPLLDVDYTGGTGALLHITGGPDLKLDEVNLIGEYVSKQLDSEAQVIWGTRVDPDFHGKIRVITVITGVKSPYIVGPVKQELKPVESYSPELGIKVFS